MTESRVLRERPCYGQHCNCSSYCRHTCPYPARAFSKGGCPIAGFLLENKEVAWKPGLGYLRFEPHQASSQPAARINFGKVKRKKLIEDFLNLPEEIIVSVLRWLSVPDLLSLRRVNHKLHNFIHEREATVCTLVTRVLLENTGMVFAETQAPNSFSAIIQTHFAYQTAVKLASSLAIPMLRTIVVIDKGSASEEQKWRETVYDRMMTRLVPALMLFDHFLYHFSAILETTDQLLECYDDSEYAELFQGMHIEDQYRMLLSFFTSNPTKVQLRLFRDTTFVVRLLSDFCAKHNFPWHRVGSQYPMATVKEVLLSHGISALCCLLDPRLSTNTMTGNHQRKLAFESMNQCLPGRKKYRLSNVCDPNCPPYSQTPRSIYGPVDTVHRLASTPHSESTPARYKRSYRARNPFINGQDLWHDATIVLMQREEAFRVLNGKSKPFWDFKDQQRMWNWELVWQKGDPQFVVHGNWF